LADTALVADIEAAKSEVDRAERVDRAFEKKTSELQEKLKEVERREADPREAATAAIRQAENEAAALEIERRSRLILQADFDRQKRDRAEKEADFERQLDAERAARMAAETNAAARIAARERQGASEVTGLREEFEGFKRKLVRAFAALIAIAAVGGAVALVTLELIVAPGLIVATVTSALLIVLLAIRLAIGAKKGDNVAAWFAVAVSIAGFAWFIVDKANEAQNPAAPQKEP